MLWNVFNSSSLMRLLLGTTKCFSLVRLSSFNSGSFKEAFRIAPLISANKGFMMVPAIPKDESVFG